MNMAYDENKTNLTLNPITLICFIFGFILIEAYYFSPYYFIYKYERGLINLKNVPFAQMLFDAITCGVYCVAGFIGNGDIQNLITNSIGLLLCLIVLVRLWFAISKGKERQNLFYLIFVINIIAQIIYFVGRADSKTGSIMSKYMAMIFNSTQFLTIYPNLIFAYQEKKISNIPILSCFLGLFACIFWAIFGLYTNKNDKTESSLITKMSNIISVIILIFPIIVYFIFKKKFGTEEHKKEKKKEHKKSDNEKEEKKEENA